MPKGTPLKLELVRQGRTVTWLASEVGLERSVVSRFANGDRRMPRIDEAQKIAKALNAPIENLWPEADGSPETVAA